MPNREHPGGLVGPWALLGLLVVAFSIGGCTKPPAGPPFARAAAPPAHRARIYLYRTDARASLSNVRVTIDGKEIGRFQNLEYETLELSAGSHQLRAGLRSLGYVAWGWNEQRIRLEPGSTLYIELSVRLTERAQPATRELDIGGRTGGVASENVYLQIRPEREALAAIETTTRLVPQ